MKTIKTLLKGWTAKAASSTNAKIFFTLWNQWYKIKDREIKRFLQEQCQIYNEKREESLSTHQTRSSSNNSETEVTNKTQYKKKYIYRDKILKIACHNINGIKSKGYKLENITAWAEEEEATFLELTETNIQEREGKYAISRHSSKYIGFWSSAKQDKKKGSGVGLLVDKEWEKHIGGVERINEFVLAVKLYFKQMQLIVITVYLPLNDKELCKIIQQKIVELVSSGRQRFQDIIMGDFNYTVNSILDRQNKERSKKKNLPLFK